MSLVLFFCVSSVVICFTDASFLFSLFLNSYIDNDCFLLLFCLAWFHLPSTTYSDGFFFITISRNRKRKSTNLACNKSFFRYVVEVCVCEQSAPQMRTNWNAFASAFRCSSTVCLFVKESLLVNFFVLLQHLCCLYYGTREVNFFCFVFIIDRKSVV